MTRAALIIGFIGIGASVAFSGAFYNLGWKASLRAISGPGCYSIQSDLTVDHWDPDRFGNCQPDPKVAPAKQFDL